MRNSFRDMTFMFTLILVLALPLTYSWAEGILEDVITGKAEIIDLTHVLSEEIPVFPGTKPFKLTNIAGYDKGYYFNEITMVEHIGTHVDAPAHFVKGTKTIDQISPRQLIGHKVQVPQPVYWLC